MYSLVLEGGGAKGAYEIGAYYALIENGYTFNRVVGTSIGALNGAMIVQGDAEKCLNMWQRESTLEFKRAERKERTGIKKLLRDATAMIEDSVGGYLDSTPLRELVDSVIDEEKIRKSPMDFGLVTFDLSKLKGLELFKKDIPEGEMKKYIIASCYHPLFKKEKIEDGYYLDGGLINNLPHKMVEGTPMVIIKNNPIGKKEVFPENALVIGPKEPLGSTLNFDINASQKYLLRGRYDALKAIGKLVGYNYYFKSIGEEKSKERLLKSLREYLKKIYREEEVEEKLENILLPRLMEEYGADNFENLLLGIIEERLREFGFDELKIYTVPESLELLRRKNYRGKWSDIKL